MILKINSLRCFTLQTVKAMGVLELKLVRSYFSKTATIGKLYFMDGDKFICDTLEDTFRKLPLKCPYTEKGQNCKCPEKVYGKTCIPIGRYRVIYRYSPKYGKMYPALENVPHFTGILIHAGSTPEHTEGCILVGTRVPDRERLKGQFTASQNMKKIVKNAIDDGNEVFITILNDYGEIEG